MTANFVTLTMSYAPYLATGNYQITASGSLVTADGIGLTIPDQQQNFDGVSSWSVTVLASDNYNYGLVLTYNIIVHTQGLDDIIATDVAVNYSNGGAQSLLSVLSDSGWTPTASD
jgi:hypothetical protein